MTPLPFEFRSILFELLYVLNRTSRLYRSDVLYAPAEIDAPAWKRLCSLAERTATQTQHILDGSSQPRGMDCELRPPISQDLEAKLLARRALRAPRPPYGRTTAPRTGLH